MPLKRQEWVPSDCRDEEKREIIQQRKAKDAFSFVFIVWTIFFLVPTISSWLCAKGEHLPYRFLIFLSSVPGEQFKLIGLVFLHLPLVPLMLFKRWQFFKGNLTDGSVPNLHSAPSLSRASESVWLNATEQWHFITQSKTSAVDVETLRNWYQRSEMNDGALSPHSRRTIFTQTKKGFAFHSIFVSTHCFYLNFFLCWINEYVKVFHTRNGKIEMHYYHSEV